MTYLRRVGRAASLFGRTVMGAGFEGASQGRRMVALAKGETDAAIDALIGSEGEILRRRARGSYRKNPYANNAVESYVANSIGADGITPQSLHPDPATRKAVDALWEISRTELDSDGLSDWGGLQRINVTTQMVAGECLARLRPRLPSDGLAVPLQVQLLNPEHLPLTKNDLNGQNTVRWGIEFTPIGKRAAYHLYRENPGLGQFAFGNPLDLVRVPAENVLHCFRQVAPGQMRGVTWLAPVLVPLYQLDQFMDATLLRQTLANMFVGVEQVIGDDGSVFLPPTGADTDEDQNDVGYGDIEGGTVLRPDSGKTIEWSKPPDPAATYAEFVKVHLRQIAAGIGITYEQLTGDLEGVNYSSIRAGLLEFRRRCEQFQFQVMVHQFCRPIWRRWINDAVIIGALPRPRNQQGWNDLYSVDWRTPKWSWVDPLKEVMAAKEEVRSGFASRSAKIRESGEDPEQVDAERAADNARDEQYDLVSDSNAAATAGTGAAQVDPDQAQEASNDTTRKAA